MTKYTEPVLVIRGEDTSDEARLLGSAGVRTFATRIASQDITVLTVNPTDARSAREILARATGLRGTIIDEDEAAYGYCYACHARLQSGENRCSNCGIFVGDPHGQ